MTDGKGNKGAWLAFRDGAGRLIQLCIARYFLVGDDAWCDILGLNRPFQLEKVLYWRLSSGIPGGQGTLVRVPL